MPALRAVAYYRMSTDQQEASIPEQREWAARAAPKAGLDLARAFDDPGIAGSEIEDRPGLMAMVAYVEAEAARKRPVKAVVVWDADRLSRASSIRTAAVLDRLMGAGVTRILTPEGWTDLENEADVLLFHVKQDFSRAAFSRSIGKNVTRNAAERAARGWHVAGKVRYGFRPVYITTRDQAGKERRTPTTLEHGDPAKVATVRWMFARYATTDDSLGDLVRQLNDLGPEQAPPPTAGGRWRRDTVWDMLQRVEYVGDKTWNVNRQGKYYEHAAGEVRKVEGGGGKKRWRHAEEGDQVIVRDAHPPVVDRETFEAVQRKLRASRLTKEHQPGRRGDWLLSGVVYCGECGGRMVGHTQRHKRKGKVYTYRRYICTANFRYGRGSCRSCAAEQDLIVRDVVGIIKTAFTDPARIKALERDLEEMTRQGDKAAEKERQALSARLALLDRQLPAAARAMLLVSPENMPEAEAALAGLKAEREDVARRLDKSTAVAESGQDYARAVLESLAELQEIEQTIVDASPAEVRTLLGRWVEKVTLHFKPPQPLADGRSRNELDYIDIDFTPAASHLLPTVASDRC